MADNLSDLQARFAQEYLIDLNATKAYLRCKPDSTVLTARTEGHRTLTNPNVQERITELCVKRAERTQITADRALQEIAAIAFARFDGVASWVDNMITLKGSAEIDPTVMPAIKQIRTFQKNIGTREDPDIRTFTEIELHDKLRALDQLCRHLGLYNDKMAVQGRVDVVYVTDEKPNKPRFEEENI